ncbi:MAG: enoyl-CoA hydratase/isomerase family protein [Dehalococcoidia bacterium]|nr:enoyl-CoA hydratase/isomerase family protein [Dehalococcoidia bacterium]
MSQEFVKTERRDGVVLATLHDPATRNAVGQEMARELLEELDRFDDDPEDRVLLLTGTDPSFCSGANVRRFDRDIQERSAESREPESLPWGQMEARLGARERRDRALGARLPLRIHQLQKPSIAAVNGHAVGLGMGLALACDIRIASERAVFSEAFVRMGLVPGDGSCWQLPRLIGLGNTFLLQYTGDRVDATEAFRMGLVARVVPHEEMLPAATELASRLARGATRSMSLTKYLVHRSLDTGLEESLELAHAAQDIARATEDHREAVQAFLQKRQPRFQGR